MARLQNPAIFLNRKNHFACYIWIVMGAKGSYRKYGKKGMREG